MKIFLSIVAVYLVIGIFYPVIPFSVKNGYHGPQGEFCGIVYNADCDKKGIRLMTYAQIGDYLNYK